MNSETKQYFEKLKTLVQAVEVLNREEWKEIFAVAGEGMFDDIDVLEMSEKEEEDLKYLYDFSVMLEAQMGNYGALFPAHIIAAISRIKNELKPLFQDATEYINTGINEAITLRAIQEAKEGKLTKFDWL